jgi:hypothetical protein
MSEQEPSQHPEPSGPTSWGIALVQGTTAVPRAAAKLLNTVADQIGFFLEPLHTRRKGKAEADAAVAKAKAEAEIAVIEAKGKLATKDLKDRADERVRRREAKRQQNLEAITAQAARELPESVAEEPVDEDWVAQFFNHCQDVSNEQMQGLWARLLAGEVTRPGSYSLRTLALVRVMTKADADLFTRFCTYVWNIDGSLIPLLPKTPVQEQAIDPFSLLEAVRLETLGLVRHEALTGFVFKPDVPRPYQLWYFGRWHMFANPVVLLDKRVAPIECGNYMLTDVGQELAKIAGSIPNEEYRSRVVAAFRAGGWEVTEGQGSS